MVFVVSKRSLSGRFNGRVLLDRGNLFDALANIRDKGFDEQQLQAKLDAMRKEAEVAWRDHRLAAVAALYRSFENALTKIEKARLQYCVRRSRRRGPLRAGPPIDKSDQKYHESLFDNKLALSWRLDKKGVLHSTLSSKMGGHGPRHEGLHHRWWDRGISLPDHSEHYVPRERFYDMLDRYKQMRGWNR
jgi:hypothetical protein